MNACITITDFKKTSTCLIQEAVNGMGMLTAFTATFGQVLSEVDEVNEHISGTVIVQFKFGNIMRQHSINVGWGDVDGYGLEDDDGELCSISLSKVIQYMYMDMALEGLADEYLE